MTEFNFATSAVLVVQGERIDDRTHQWAPMIPAGASVPGHALTKGGWVSIDNVISGIVRRADYRDVHRAVMLYPGAAPVRIETLEEAQKLANEIWVPRDVGDVVLDDHTITRMVTRAKAQDAFILALANDVVASDRPRLAVTAQALIAAAQPLGSVEPTTNPTQETN